MSSFDKYIESLKQKLDDDPFSPLFIRLANLYFLDGRYDDCIDTCKTGLVIYPYYVTAKLLLLRAYLKMEYVNEAELLINELELKLANLDYFSTCKNKLEKLKKEVKQERIYYPDKIADVIEYKNYQKEFTAAALVSPEIETEALIEQLQSIQDTAIDEKLFEEFKSKLNVVKLEARKPVHKEETKVTSETESSFGKIKIITETLADIYAGQGNFKEAFDAYNFLLRAGSGDRARIENKLAELERAYGDGY